MRQSKRQEWAEKMNGKLMPADFRDLLEREITYGDGEFAGEMNAALHESRRPDHRL